MKLTYIGHSGFALEGEQSAIVFDFFRDSENAFVRRILPVFQGKPYILCSHWHPDHFNKVILDWKNIRPDIQYLFSRDILEKKLASSQEATFLDRGDVWQDENITVKAFGSTDVGISFLIETEGKKIFHAGDLNNWHWDEESTPEEIQTAEQQFLNEIQALHQETETLDLAMFPVDCRLGKNYMRGPQQFVDLIHTKIFSPMHFGVKYKEANAFQPYAEKAGCTFVSWTKKGVTINI